MSIHPDNDRLKKLFQSVPPVAMRYLSQNYYDRLVTISERRTRDLASAEDIVQEAFLEVWNKRNWIARHKHLLILPYIIAMVTNRSISQYKRSQKVGLHQKLFMRSQRDAAHPSMERDFINAERWISLWRIISTFPRRERECLMLKFHQTRTIGEISVELGISKKAVERSITSGYKRLRQYRAIIS